MNKNWVYLVIAMVAGLIYGPHLANPLLHYDDFLFTATFLPEAFANFSGFLQSYMGSSFFPVSNLTMLPDFALCGTQGFCYHFTSLLFHAGTGAAFYGLLLALEFGVGVSAVLALIFVTHISATEVTYWMAARNFVVALFFCMLAGQILLRYRQKPTIGRYFLLLGAFLLALLSKSSSIALGPVVVLVWPYSKQRKTVSATLLLPFVLGVSFIIWTVLHYSAVSGPHQSDFVDMPFAERLAVAVPAFFYYLQEAVAGFRSNMFYDVQRFSLTWWQWAAAMLWLPIAVVAFRHNRRLAVIAGIWYLGVMLPILKLVPYGEILAVNDRYLYSGLPALLVLAGLCWNRVLPRARTAVAAIAGGAIALQAYTAFAQGAYWKSDEALWSNVLFNDNYCSIAHTAIGKMYLVQGDAFRAQAHLEQALLTRPNSAVALLNLASVKRNRGESAQAVELVEAALKSYPELPEAHDFRAHLYLDAKNPEAALNEFEFCVRFAGVRPSCSLEAAKIYAASGKCDRAKPHLEQVIRHGESAEAQTLLAQCSR